MTGFSHGTGISSVILVRPDGIGDEILSLPVATELKRNIPSVRVSFLSSVYAAPLFEHHPDIDEVITLTRQETFGELVRIFSRGFDAAVFLKPYRNLMAAAWFAGVPNRVGTGYRWYSFLLNRRVYQHRKHFSKHESEYNVELLTGLGLSPDAVGPPRLFPSPAEELWAQTYLGHRKGKRVVVHPGGFSSRSWGQERFRELTVGLAEKGYEVILTGSRDERGIFCGPADETGFPSEIRNFMGELTLRQLMAIIGESDVVVSMSTGPMHIAAALGVPTVSIFDPRRSSLPTRWKPLGAGVIVMPEVPICERCSQEKCDYWDCLQRISAASVIEQIDNTVSHPAPLEIVHI